MAPRKTPRRGQRSHDVEEDNFDQNSAPNHSPGATKVDSEAKSEDGHALDIEQEIWNSVREEQYEVIEQLPLTLHRLFVLLRELDDRYTAQMSELQSVTRKYVELRRSLANAPRGPSALTLYTTGVVDGIDPELYGQPKAEPNNYPDAPISPPSQAADSTTTGQSTIPSNTSISPSPPQIPRAGETRRLLERIGYLTAESVRLSDEKLALGTTVYDLVDRHVRSLDLSIKSEEAAFSFGGRPGTLPLTVLNGASSSSGTGTGAVSGINGVAADQPTNLVPSPSNGASEVNGKPKKKPPKRARLRGSSNAASTTDSQARAQTAIAPPVGDSSPLVALAPIASNLAIDPNEPRYCYCNQVSYGEMIACDNDECEREWFHYSCVGLTEAPKRRWFCETCEVALGIQSRKKKHS